MSNENLGKQWIAEIIGDVKKRRDDMQKHLSRLKNEGHYKQAHVDALALLNAMLSAAAPKVAADERAAFEVHITDNGTWPRAAERSVDGEYRLMATAVAWNTWRAATDSFASRAAAPVQAQEPVAETYAHTMSNGRGRPDDPAPFETVCVRLLRNDLPADLKLYAALVQPVAVPDGWRDAALESAVQAVVERAGESEKIDVINAFDAIRSLKKNRHALPESCSSFAAPAAQGDKMMCVKCHSSKVAGRADCPECGCKTFSQRDAIAAKAAS